MARCQLGNGRSTFAAGYRALAGLRSAGLLGMLLTVMLAAAAGGCGSTAKSAAQRPAPSTPKPAGARGTLPEASPAGHAPTSSQQPADAGSGGAWKEHPAPGARDVYGLSCGSVTFCVATVNDASANNALWVTVDGGVTWAERHVSGGSTDPVGVSCVSNEDCAAVGVADPGPAWAWISTDRGATWTKTTIPSAATQEPAVGGFTGLSCTSPQACLAAGADGSGNGASWSTDDGGATWTMAAVPDTSDSTKSNGGPVAAACTTATTCVLVGTTTTG